MNNVEYDQLRHGNVVLVVVPQKNVETRKLVVAYVCSIWKCQKKPQLSTNICPIGHVVAFRCVEMTPCLTHPSEYECSDSSDPWILKPHALVGVLDVCKTQECIEKLRVKLTEHSMQLIESSMLVGEWWPYDEEGDAEQQVAGLYTSRKRGRKVGGTKKGDEPEEVTKKSKTDQTVGGEKVPKTKTVAKSHLKKTPVIKPIAFEPSNFKKNGSGPALVRQMMERLKAIEEQKFETTTFDEEGACLLNVDKCLGVQWADIVASTHAYFICQFLG